MFLKEEKDSIIAIKFMYSNDYPSDINYLSFWQNPEEHAKLEMFTNNSENFIKRLKSYPKKDSSAFEFMNYAFIINHNQITDTIYADLDLNTWIIFNNGTKEYYEDVNEELKVELQTRYGFFKSCW